MQDAEESQPPNRWRVAWVIASLSQLLGIAGISRAVPNLPMAISVLLPGARQWRSWARLQMRFSFALAAGSLTRGQAHQ